MIGTDKLCLYERLTAIENVLTDAFARYFDPICYEDESYSTQEIHHSLSRLRGVLWDLSLDPEVHQLKKNGGGQLVCHVDTWKEKGRIYCERKCNGRREICVDWSETERIPAFRGIVRQIKDLVREPLHPEAA